MHHIKKWMQLLEIGAEADSTTMQEVWAMVVASLMLTKNLNKTWNGSWLSSKTQDRDSVAVGYEPRMALETYWWVVRLWNGLSRVRWAGRWLAVARARSFWVRRIWLCSPLQVALPRSLASLRRKSTNASDPQLKHEVEHPCHLKIKIQSFPRVKSAESCTQICKNTQLNCLKKD